MSDEELETLARAATPIRRGGTWIRLIRSLRFGAQDEQFLRAANPATVLSLLERLKKAEAQVGVLEDACRKAHRELFLGDGDLEAATRAEKILAATKP